MATLRAAAYILNGAVLLIGFYAYAEGHGPGSFFVGSALLAAAIVNTVALSRSGGEEK
jgi:hypothetical protein